MKKLNIVLSIVIVLFWIFYLIYSIIFRHKITYFFREVEVVEGKEKNFLKMQLSFSIFNSLIASLIGIYSFIYSPSPSPISLIPAIFHFINHIAKERSKIDRYIK